MKETSKYFGKMAKSSKKTEEVAVQRLGTQDIPAMLRKVNKSLKSLKGNGDEKHKAITTRLEGYGVISEINSVEKMIQAYASVNEKEKAYNNAAESLGIDIKKYPCKLNGVSPDSWKKELKVRVLEVKNQVEIKELTELKDMLEDNLSIEDKLAKKLSGYADKLSAFDI